MSNNNENNPSTSLRAGLVPKLRFPEFEDEWDKDLLGNIARDITTGKLDANAMTEGGQYRFYTCAKNYYMIDKYAFDKEALLIAGNGAYLGYIHHYKGKFNAYQRTYVLSEFTHNVIYLKYFLERYLPVRIKLEKKEGNTPYIVLSTLTEMQIYVPKSPTEQQKIASCLSSLDEVIAAENKKLEVLKEHKKGLLQSLFPSRLNHDSSDLHDEHDTKNQGNQENQKNQSADNVPRLRFKEFAQSGEWAERKLGEVAANVMYGMNAPAVEYDGENKYIRITDIDEITRIYSPNPITSPKGQLEDKYLVNVGDILFARTGASVGKSYLHQSENGKIYFAGFLIRMTIINEIPLFIYAQTLTDKYQKWVLETSMRSGQPGINAEEYKSYPIYLPPSIQEQQKIASCLSSLDDLITAQTQKIEWLQRHKKGLLQGLFPQLSSSELS